MFKRMIAVTGLALLVGCILAACAVQSAPKLSGNLTGSVLYRERIALDPTAVIEVILEDISKADAPAELVASQTIKTDGKQVPIQFELAYDPAKIEERNRYAVRARILVDGVLRWTSQEVHLVLTQGNPADNVEILVIALPPSASEPTAPGAITGVVWKWTESLDNSGKSTVPPDSEEYTLEFMSDGTFAFRASCNRGAGGYTIDGNQLSIMPGPMTLAACPEGSLDSQFIKELGMVTSFLFDDQDLILEWKFDSGTMRFAH